MPENETHFFQALSTAVGTRYLKARSLGSKVGVSDVFLEKEYRLYGFPDRIGSILSTLLCELGSVGHVGSGSLSHHVDGLLVDHPDLGSRIIEFDEEQHFNTFRLVTLRLLSSCLELPYLQRYEECCSDPVLFNRMLRKHRLKVEVEAVPETIESFLRLVLSGATPKNGYIAPKTGFDFVGGRLAQRSYYDTLRDVAHLSPKNQGMATPIRMNIFEFEAESGRQFSSITRERLRTMIEHRLRQLAGR